MATLEAGGSDGQPEVTMSARISADVQRLSTSGIPRPSQNGFFFERPADLFALLPNARRQFHVGAAIGKESHKWHQIWLAASFRFSVKLAMPVAENYERIGNSNWLLVFSELF